MDTGSRFAWKKNFNDPESEKRMEKKLFVGNLSYNASEDELKDLFAEYGTVQSVDVVRDRYSGQAKGFAFVEMSTGEEAEKSLALNGAEFLGRNINVAIARPPKPRTEGRRGGGFGGGGGFGNRPRGRSW